MKPVFLLLFCAAGFAEDPPKPTSIVVTGVFEPIPLDEADRAIRSLPLDATQRILSATVFDYLRLDPSLDVKGRAPNGLQTDLSIRGGNFGQTLVLLDGIRLNDAQSGHHNLDIPVPLSTLGRVEILKGSGSAFYGSDAVGGVVNLITKSPEAAEFTLRAGIGNFGVNQESGSLTGVWKSVTQQLAFSRDFSSGFQSDRGYRNLSLASITHVRGADITLAHNDRPYGADQFYGNYNSWERTRTWFASIRQRIGENTEASFAFRRHTDLFVLYRDRPAVFTNRHAVEGYQAALRRHDTIAPNYTISYGGEAFRDEIESNNLGRHQRNYGAVYAALDVRALKRYSFTAGGREEIFKGGGRQFNPTASFGAWISPHWKLRASASRAFRLPSYTDLYYHDPANVGSPTLKPESAWSSDGALEWNPSQRIHGEIGVFHRRERNGIDYVRYSPTELWRATNFSRLNFTGAEASFKIHPFSSHFVDLSFFECHGVQAMYTDVHSKYIFNFPTHAASVTWQAVLPNGFMLRTRIGVTNRFGRDPYGLWDLYLAHRHGRWSPFAQFTNLTATRYQEIDGVAMPGRAAVVGFEIRLK